MFTFGKGHREVRHFTLIVASLTMAMRLPAQATPAATKQLDLSGFAFLGDTYTGLGGAYNGLGGRNFSLTAGIDAALVNLHRVEISAEGRGTYPLLSGQVDSQKSVLGGVRFSTTFARDRRNSISPYIDFLAGRGTTNYVHGGYPVPPLLYISSSGNVLDGGGGLQVRLSRSFSLVFEAQFQRWSTPVTMSKHIEAKQANGGIAYRFGSGSKPRVGER